MNIEKINIHFFNPQELLEEDASLSFGHLVIESRGVEIKFFGDKNCMIFISLDYLIHQLFKYQSSSRNIQFEWIGDGHGATYLVNVNAEKTTFTLQAFEVRYATKELTSKLVDYTKKFLLEVSLKNPEIKKEPAFEDLNNTIQQFK